MGRRRKIRLGETLINQRVALQVTNPDAGVDSKGQKLIVCRCGFCNKEASYLEEKFSKGEIENCKICAKQAEIKRKEVQLSIGDTIDNCTVQYIRTTGSNITYDVKCNKCGKMINNISDDTIKHIQDQIKHRAISDTRKGQGSRRSVKLTAKGRILSENTNKVKNDNIIKSDSVVESDYNNYDIEHICSCQNIIKMEKPVGIIEGLVEGEINKTKAIKAIKEYSGYEYIGTRRSQMPNVNKPVFAYMCLNCCNVITLTENDILKNRFDGHCEKCEELKNDNKPSVLTQLDWVGYTKNGMRIERVFDGNNGIRMCEVRCMLCNNTEKLALASFITRDDIICKKCGEKMFVMRCPECGKVHIKTNMKSLYLYNNTGKYKCNETGKEISKEDLVSEHEFQLERQYLKSKYNNEYKFKKHIRGGKGRADLIAFDSGYTGMDGQEYSNCMCIEHNRFICLSESEMTTYNHEYCFEPRMQPYKTKCELH